MAENRLIFNAPPLGPERPARLVFGDEGEEEAAPPRFPVRLVFDQPPAPGLPVRLVFGRADEPPPPELPAATLSGGGQISGLRVQMPAAFDINASRPTVGRAAVRYQDASGRSGAVASPYQQSLPILAGAMARYQAGRAAQAGARSAWQQAENLAHWARSKFEQATAAPGAPLAQGFQEAQRARTAARLAWQQARILATLPLASRFEETIHLRAGGLGSFKQAHRMGALVRSIDSYALPGGQWLGGTAQDAWPPRPGQWVKPTKPPAPDACYTPALPVRLAFTEAGTNGAAPVLAFLCGRHAGPAPQPGGTVVVPIQRVYIVLNTITLTRVDTGAELRAHTFSLNLDYQSWTWSWTASLHHDAGLYLGRDNAGDPTELEASINGVTVRLRLERITEDRRFLPQLRWSVSGKGKASILGAPYAPNQSFNSAVDRTAQQLAAEALTVNGVGIGWAFDWDIVDWLVPGGAWALQGRYIDAINDIVGAAGGYVQPHSTDAVLRVLPRYPSAPWEWGGVTPDFEIPGTAAEVVGIEHVDKPEYNRVFLGGVSTGVFGPFTRTGTAGNLIAPPVNHALITHADVHRARGIAELSDTGRQEHVSLRMQVVPETGLVMPGQFVRYVGDRTLMGIVRSTSIEWNRPTLRQTIGIETHAD